MERHLIDISRTISRIDRGFATGIDRVELAYINYLIADNPDNLFVARLGRYSVLLDVPMVRLLLEKIKESNAWGRPSLVDAVRLKLSWEQRSARSFIKRHCLAKARNGNVGRLFNKIDLGVYRFWNVGHSNLTDTMFSALKAGGCRDINVLIHDMIPLDFPEFSKSHIPKVFEKRMRTVAKYATRIICNSEETRQRVRFYFRKWGGDPSYLVAHLGVEPMKPDPGSRPIVDRPYFVILGTIEPRKNHLLLFRVWERLATRLPPEKMPLLYIVGRRGWANVDIFQFLDESMLVGNSIIEKNELDDQNLANLLTHANALLFPSFVEGFGLPALEAAQIGLSVYCSDINALREILGPAAVYRDPNSIEQWETLIYENITDQRDDMPENSKRPKIPTWESHFRHVFG